jgi:hypothetical protein
VDRQGWIDRGWIDRGWIDRGWIDRGWIDRGWIERGDSNGDQVAAADTSGRYSVSTTSVTPCDVFASRPSPLDRNSRSIEVFSTSTSAVSARTPESRA